MTKVGAININQKQSLTFVFMMLMTLIAFMATAFAGPPASWQNQDIKVKGTWAIEERADGSYLVLSEDFKTKNAPDLKFFVSSSGYESINGSNATNGAVQIAKLKSNKGAQSFKIPSNVNISDYKSLVLHCEQYSKMWASTPLN